MQEQNFLAMQHNRFTSSVDNHHCLSESDTDIAVLIFSTQQQTKESIAIRRL